MSTQRDTARQAAPIPRTLAEFFTSSITRAPRFLEYKPIEHVDDRALRAGEMMRITAMLRGDAYRENDPESQETRCAAAYVAAKIGLMDAIPVIAEAISRGVADPVVKSALMHAHFVLSGMEERDSAPKKDDQLVNLLKMRNSAVVVERRFAEIVLEKAAIQYGTLTSW